MLIAQRIDTLTGGVSQQPAPLRDGSQAQEILNAYLHPTLGCLKRPPTVHVAQLSDDPTGFDTAFVHTIKRSATERYLVIVVGGDLLAFDALTGETVTVTFPDGKGYLSGTSWRAVTVGDTTYLIDRAKVIAKGSTISPATTPEALVSVRAGDFSTKYTITLSGLSATYTTPVGSAPDARTAIATDAIATKLKAAIAATAGLSGFTVTQFGSTLHIVRTDAHDFSIAVSDGLADQALFVVKGAVQRFEDLPPRAPDGTIIQVIGDPASEIDDYWVKYTDLGLADQGGVWKETVKPSELVGFDASTMPHLLVRQTDGLDGVASAGTPPAPDIYTDSAALVAASVVRDDNGASQSDDTAPLFFFGAGPTSVPMRASIPSGATGVRIRYLIGSTVIATQIKVELQQNTAPGNSTYNTIASAIIDTNQYAADRDAGGMFTLQGTLSGTGDRVRVQASLLNGGVGYGWTTYYGFLAAKNNADGAGVRFVTSSDKYVNFGRDTVYAEGSTLTLTVNSTDVDYLLTSDKTGKQVATAFAPLVAALSGVSATNPSDGIVKITPDTPGASITCTYANDFDDATTFHNPDLALTTDGLVGKTITNITDGSSAIITSNTATTISVASLSGGSSNDFAAGDICSVPGVASFVFKQGEWTERAAGNLTSNPFPTFVGRAVSEVFFHRGRLGLTYGNSLALSQAGEPLNFFRTTVKQLLDGDPINAKSVEVQADFHSAVSWNSALLLWTNVQQANLEGEPLLTPKSIKFPTITEYPNTPIRPVAAGRHVYFAAERQGYTQVHQWGIPRDSNTAQPEAFPITKDVPKYLVGSPVKLAGWVETGMVFALTTTGTKLYVRAAALNEDGQEVRAGWNTWTFSSTILDFDVSDGVVTLVMLATDGVYLETLTLG